MRDYTQADAANVLAEIERLKVAHPDLADDAALLRDTIEGETNFTSVLGKIVSAALESRFLADGLTNYIETLNARQRRFTRKETSLRGIAESLLKASGEKSLVLPVATLSMRQGPVSVTIDDLEAIPQGMFRIETTKVPLKKELKDALLAGERIPGVSLSTPEASLSIRSK